MSRPRNEKGELYCKTCSDWFPADQFPMGRSKRGNRVYSYPKPECLSCHSKSNSLRSNEWRKNNKSRVNKLNADRRRRLRSEFVSAYGGKCACCGEREQAFLTIEHVFGKGKKVQPHLEIERLKRAGWPKDAIQLFCFNCNSAKGIYGSCPHSWPDGEYKLPLTIEERRRLYKENEDTFYGRQ